MEVGDPELSAVSLPLSLLVLHGLRINLLVGIGVRMNKSYNEHDRQNCIFDCDKSHGYE